MLDAPVTADLQPQVAPGRHDHTRCYCNGGWCVARTHPQAERWADANLRRSGYPTYLPLVAVQRRDRAIRALLHTIHVPLFPGYVFVAHDPRTSWRPIYETPGIRSMVRNGSQLQYARPGAVEALQAAEALRAWPLLPGAAWRPGAACRLRAGPFAGQEAVVAAVRADRITISVMCLGALRSVVVPAEWLDRRDE